ncbi:hypothetical protein [Acinetobacter zhairhuonensis]|jgi:hypothetical protein|uniref:hypothetical protein n=1 Tax=Acinetobacter sp. A7.4 TaxID=2919921 RepID=UPI001F4F1CAE|nr:hypothetical protein [Acinetobacter sp. A7.4]MCJ8162909.1 hypothetical protein [Acinetobacter sp. A7.4]
MAVYRTLVKNKPIIMQISTTPLGYPSRMSHMVVIRGIFFQPTPSGVIPMLIVNDPLSLYTQPVPFVQLAQIWRTVIVVHD